MRLSKKITEKKRRFIDEYLVDGNASQAAIRAGYKGVSARITGCNLVRDPMILAEIEKGRQKMRDKIEITKDAIIDELRKIAFADIRNAVKWGEKPEATSEEGIYPVSLVPSNIIDDDTAGAVSEVSLTNNGVKVKMYDKKGALMDLAKMLGYVVDKAEVEQRMSVTFSKDDADL